MKAIFAALFASLILLASADDKCGETCTWTIENGELKISGSGAMNDYNIEKAPWNAQSSSITKVSVQGLKSIGKSAFKKMEKLEKATIDAEEIGDYCFEGCKKLDDVVLSDNVKKIGSMSFDECVGLKRFTVSKGVNTIDNTAFLDCSNLEEFSVAPDNRDFAQTGGVLFSNDRTKLIMYPPAKEGDEYEIEEGVETLKNYAFRGAANLKKITISKTVSDISAYVFGGCVNLDTISVNSENQHFFTDNVALIGKLVGVLKYPAKHEGEKYTIPDGVKLINVLAFEGCTNLEEIKLPDGITVIDTQAFAGCSNLKSITFPDSVTNIMSDVFDGCTGLEEITVKGDKSKCYSDDGVFFCKDYSNKPGLVKYPAKKAVEKYTIGDTVEKINKLAFEGCSNLELLTIPASVSSIQAEAFVKCGKLSSVEYQGKKNPGYGSFVDCPKVTSVCIADDYQSDQFCGIKKLVKCHSDNPDSSFTVIPSFVAIITMVFFAFFF